MSLLVDQGPPKPARLLGAGGKLQKEQGLRDWPLDGSEGGGGPAPHGWPMAGLDSA